MLIRTYVTIGYDKKEKIVLFVYFDHMSILQ